MSPLHPPLEADPSTFEVMLTFEGEPPQRMTLGALFEANADLDPEERSDIVLSLRVGQPYHGGGGAAAAYRLDLAAAP